MKGQHGDTGKCHGVPVPQPPGGSGGLMAGVGWLQGQPGGAVEGNPNQCPGRGPR